MFANVTRIAKYGRLSISAALRWAVEVVSRRHRHRWRIAAMALRAATIGLGARAHDARRRCSTLFPARSTAKSSTWRSFGAHHRLYSARRRHGRANPDVADPDPNPDRTHSPLLGPFGIEL